ncbi:MAG: hypothetical protein ACOYVF_05885 [Candidatus Zixiibacteriota bacterium]
MKKVLFSLVLLLFVDTVYAEKVQTGHQDLNNENKIIPIENYLTPDGRVDMQAVRSSGYQGALDLDGKKLAFDPVNSEPILYPLSNQASDDHPDDIYWDNYFFPVYPGVDGEVYAMTVYDGALIIGGDFSVVGDIVAHNIAA